MLRSVLLLTLHSNLQELARQTAGLVSLEIQQLEYVEIAQAIAQLANHSAIAFPARPIFISLSVLVFHPVQRASMPILTHSRASMLSAALEEHSVITILTHAVQHALLSNMQMLQQGFASIALKHVKAVLVPVYASLVFLQLCFLR